MSAGDHAAVRFAAGVRFRRLPDGSGVLLVPEGVVNLSESAAAIAELVDGFRPPDAIAEALAASFDAPRDRIEADVRALLARFSANTWLATGPHSLERSTFTKDGKERSTFTVDRAGRTESSANPGTEAPSREVTDGD